MLLPNPPGGFIDKLQKCASSSYGTEKKIGLAEEEKPVIKKKIKGGMGRLLDIRQFINGLKLIWICKFLNANHKWIFFSPSCFLL